MLAQWKWKNHGRLRPLQLEWLDAALSIGLPLSKALADGPVSSSQVNPTELAAICDEFPVEGARQSRKLADDPHTSLNLTAARRLTHRWAGTGGTLGFPHISRSHFESKGCLSSRTDLRRS